MTNWMLAHTGKWHAWTRGARASVCGRINAETLRQQPARIITFELPPDADATTCAVCRARVQHTAPTSSESPTPAERAWMGHLRAHTQRVRVRVADADLWALAGLLAEVGQPSDPAAQDVYTQIRTLLLTPTAVRQHTARGRSMTLMRLPRLREAVAKLPPRSGALQRVAAAMRSWRIAAGGDTIPGRFKPDQVVDVMLQIPDMDPYVKHLAARGFKPLGVMFHPNVLARARTDAALRGVFGTGTAEWDRIADRINIVTD